MHAITPFLWYDQQAEEAARLYTAIFRPAKISEISRHGAGRPGPRGQVSSVRFELAGLPFLALNGGPRFRSAPAISFLVTCRTQQEIDSCWRVLSAGGKKQPCGWVTDRFGLSWQIVPSLLETLLNGRDPVRSGRVMEAMLQMTKLDIRKLRRAYAGRCARRPPQGGASGLPPAASTGQRRPSSSPPP